MRPIQKRKGYRQSVRRLPLLFAALALAACEDDPFSMGRADSGVVGQDAGSNGPLLLEPGMTFIYQGILTARPNAGQDEHNSTWFMTVTIDAVDDQGPTASTLRFSASNTTTSDDDWGGPDDFDSWVGRLGPSQAEDQVGSAPIASDLHDAPELPPPPLQGIKPLPMAGTFFLDMRNIDAIRAAFAQRFADARPRVGDPSDNSGRWVFETSGTDPTIQFYPSQERRIRIEYDPRGFMMRLEENLGDPDRRTPPYASNRIVLMSGPS